MVADRAPGRLHDYLLAGLVAHQRLAEGRILADGAGHDVRLLGTHDTVCRQLLAAAQLRYGNNAADGDLVGILALVHDHRVQQDILQLCDAGVQLALLVFRLIVLAVLAEVAEAAGLLDQLRHLIGTGGLAVIQFLFQLVIAGLTHFEFFRHAAHSFLLVRCP